MAPTSKHTLRNTSHSTKPMRPIIPSALQCTISKTRSGILSPKPLLSKRQLLLLPLIHLPVIALSRMEFDQVPVILVYLQFRKSSSSVSIWKQDHHTEGECNLKHPDLAPKPSNDKLSRKHHRNLIKMASTTNPKTIKKPYTLSKETLLRSSYSKFYMIDLGERSAVHPTKPHIDTHGEYSWSLAQWAVSETLYLAFPISAFLPFLLYLSFDFLSPKKMKCSSLKM